MHGFADRLGSSEEELGQLTAALEKSGEECSAMRSCVAAGEAEGQKLKEDLAAAREHAETNQSAIA